MKTRKKVLIGAGNQELQVSGSPAQARGISDKGYSDANLSTTKGYTDSEIQKLDSSASPASGNNVLTGITITNGKITGSTSASAVLTSGNQTIAGNKTFSGDTTLSGLVTAGKTNFISSLNEFNFIPAGFNSAVHINYRSAAGSAAAVSSYYFDSGDSQGGLADLYAKKGVFTSLQSATAPSASIDVARLQDLLSFQFNNNVQGTTREHYVNVYQLDEVGKIGIQTGCITRSGVQFDFEFIPNSSGITTSYSYVIFTHSRVENIASGTSIDVRDCVHSGTINVTDTRYESLTLRSDSAGSFYLSQTDAPADGLFYLIFYKRLS